ncbi:histidine phosphatase family protein [Phnomibacter sp. MR]|uniref:histidine phosphatase family protein n=1 Tax=Phnomibacter sp. MR TaxID=3042318 RepID=UPI003A7F787D
MRPHRIILVRHGESEGNFDRNTYAQKQDYKLLLTPLGEQQADEAGNKLQALIGDESILFYVSPLWRTRMTFEHIAKHFDKSQYRWKEDPRLREQEWGHFRDLKANIQIDDERNKFGTFYYRIKDGESCADVYDRVSDFMHSMYRDFEKPKFPKNVIVVSHGMTVRLFLMRWFHWTVEEFETLRNPKNAEFIVMEQDAVTGKYKLVTELKRKNTRPEDEYKWNIIGR